MKDISEVCLTGLPPCDGATLLQSSGSLVCLAGALYREAQIKHPRCARFSLKNDKGLFFVKVYQEPLVALAAQFEAGNELMVIGEMHSYVSRRCKNHHVFIKAAAIFPVTELCAGWTLCINNGKTELMAGEYD